MSLRRRLLFTALATLTIGLGALLLIGNLLLAHTIERTTSRELHARADAEIASLDVSAAGVRLRPVTNDRALEVQAWVFSDGVPIKLPPQPSPSLDRLAATLAAEQRPVTAPGSDSLTLLGVPVSAPDDPHRIVGSVVVGVDYSEFEQLKRNVLIGSIAIGILIAIAAAAAIERALGGALRVVRRMTEDAEAWGTDDLDRRFDLGPPHDEITGLAGTLDHLLDRIAAARRHEQRFAAEVAHELRTPLAVIRGHAELRLDMGAGEPSFDQTLTAIVGKVDDLSATIDSLLAVADAELSPQRDAFDVRLALSGFDGIEIAEITEPEPIVAEGDPEIVRRALAPLIDNARRHAVERVTVEASTDGGRVRVTVRDDGPGLDPALGEEAFTPGRRGAGATDAGAGLGLPLARRLARACGGDVVIGPGPGGCFMLELPRASHGPPATDVERAAPRATRRR